MFYGNRHTRTVRKILLQIHWSILFQLINVESKLKNAIYSCHPLHVRLALIIENTFLFHTSLIAVLPNPYKLLVIPCRCKCSILNRDCAIKNAIKIESKTAKSYSVVTKSQALRLLPQTIIKFKIDYCGKEKKLMTRWMS